MIFPNLALWNSRDPSDAAGQIDRALNDRNHRLSVGISVSKRLDKVRGALVVTQGNGKYIRVRHVVHAEEDIPRAIRSGIQEVSSAESRDLNQCAQLLADLSEIQAVVVSKLQCEAGKYVDRVLAVSVYDPGFWSCDFDGRVSFSSMCDPTQLAERSGISVIDSFPSRDLVVNGSGSYLEALPCWLLFADRNPKMAVHNRALVSVEDQTVGYAFPPSDGLDSEVPEIEQFTSTGLQFLNELTSRHLASPQELIEFDQMYADGRDIPELRAELQRILSDSEPTLSNRELHQRLAESADQFIQGKDETFSSVLRSGIEWVATSIAENLSATRIEKIDELLIACAPQHEACLVNRLTQSLPDVEVMPIRKSGFYGDDLDSIVAALLGLFHIDQLPANVPWITGADSQRILGRLTPGRPSNWRQLVRAMADFHPPPMKLRDAV